MRTWTGMIKHGVWKGWVRGLLLLHGFFFFNKESPSLLKKKLFSPLSYLYGWIDGVLEPFTIRAQSMRNSRQQCRGHHVRS